MIIFSIFVANFNDRMKSKAYNFFIPFLLCFYGIHVYASVSYESRLISTADGLTCNTINDMTQDDYGYMWIGTSNGLCRYDGYSFVNFHKLGSKSVENTDPHVALLFNDDRNKLLWVYTSKHSLACYDLRKAKFVDYTGCGDEDREFKNRYLSPNGMWLYDDCFGARCIRDNNGTLKKTDYTKENHLLPTNKIHTVREDFNNNVWFFTEKGAILVDKRGREKIFLKGHDIIASRIQNKYIIFITAENNAYVYDNKYRLIKHGILPSMMGHINKITSNIIWQNKWFIFTDSETFAMDLKTGVFYKPSDIQIKNGRERWAATGYYFISDDNGNLTIFPNKGSARKFNLIPNIKYTKARDGMFNIVKDQYGILYIATYGNGLFIFNPKDGTMVHHTPSDARPLIYSNFLLDIMIDRSGCIWVSTETAGLSCINSVGSATANFIYPESKHKDDWANYVRHIYKKDDENIIISTKENKLYDYNTNNKSITLQKEMDACVYAYFKDSKGHTWIGTRGGGLYVDGIKYSKNDSKYNVPVNDFYDIGEDCYGRIWIATWDGGLLMTKYSPKKPLKFNQYLNRSFKERRIHNIEFGKNGELWIATNNGLYYIDSHKRNITDKSFICYNTANHMLPNDEIISLKHTSKGTLWIGALGSGAVECKFSPDHKSLKYHAITTSEGLVNNNVNSIIEDNNGDIWAGTEGGISRINGHDFSIKTYQFSNVLQGNVYSEDCAVKLKDGRLMFGTNYGLTAITPEKEMQIHKASKIKACITDVKVNGKSLYEKEAGNEKLDMALNYMKCISLNHKENTIEISFSNFNYNSIKTSLYQYYLEGLSSDWHSSTTTNKVNYNSLAPGHYIFHLRTLNGSNKWSDETTLDINIEEPWYNTWMAWAVYILIAYAIGYYIYKGWKERFRLHQQLQIDQQLTEFRLNFFTHIAHEFRTPLAVIQGAVDKLSNSEGRNTSKSAIQTANRGTKRLLRLVNQLMEFRKVSTENIKLNVEHADLISFVRDIYQDFWPITRQKDISITFTPFDKKYEMLFDKHVVELIVYNIISNAVKYTPTKGKVSIKIIKDQQYHKICIICEDNGPGISEEQMQNLFQPFMHGYVSNGGMGIGLYTAHNMAKAHKGALTYNRVDAKGGSIFTFIFPDDDNVYSPEEYKSDLAVETKDVLDENANIEIREMLPASINDYTVAVIEDDPDMMEQIKNELSVYFNVEGYMNGQFGCEGVLKTHPVLLICDVMLPDMSGYEIVKKIKQDKDACHIPVIMLTALDDENHQIKGYEAGADDYMVKPCNFRILIVRAIQLIKWSIRLESEKTSNIGDSNDFAPAAHLTADSILTNKADKVFKEKVQHIISQHIEDTDFNVDVLASMMNMGRTKFYGKMRELTGIPPNKYLSNERMRIAAELLIENELSISEISYKVGIQDASYFNKCFKAKYGVVPSKYGKK